MIRDPGPTPLPEPAHQGEVRRATWAAVAVAATLIVAKSVTWLLTDSVALLSSLVDSLLDLAASAVNLLAVRTAQTPADEAHRYGHGKAEPLAALAQACFIAGSAVFLVAQAVQRLITPQPVGHGGLGIVVMLGSMILTGALVLYQRRVIAQAGSLAVEADSLHYTGDLLANGAVIIALVLVDQLGWLRADPAISILIAVYILHSAREIGLRALDVLMDRELPPEDREKIIAVLDSTEGLEGWHDLRTRSSGPHRFVQVHVEMPGQLSLARAHEVAHRLEERIAAALGPGCDVIVHQDPFPLPGRT
jgi:ferrous-iron efflux pump FieF